MSSMDVDGDNEKSTTTFRWINVARYVVASVVTVLIAAVVVIAIKMVVRPDTLKVRVIGGSIHVVRLPAGAPPKQLLQLQFQVRADNPSGRAVMYYHNIIGYLFDKNVSASTLNPQADCFVSLKILNINLLQQQAVVSITQGAVGPNQMTRSYFDMLYHDRSSRMDGVTLRIDGDLITEPITGGFNTTRSTTYLCSPLVIVGRALTTTSGGGNDNNEANKSTQDSVVCEIFNSTATSAR